MIAFELGFDQPVDDTVLGGPFVLVFVTSYLPIVCILPSWNYSLSHQLCMSFILQPLFLLCIFGYKLIRQTSFVELHEMDFDRGDMPPSTDDEEEEPRTWWQKLKNLLF